MARMIPPFPKEQAMRPEPPTPVKTVTVRCTYFGKKGYFYMNAKQIFLASDFGPLFVRPRDYGVYLNAVCKLPGLGDGMWRDPFSVTVNGETDLIIPEFNQ